MAARIKFITNMLGLLALTSSSMAFAQRVEVKNATRQATATGHTPVMSHEAVPELSPKERALRQVHWMRKNINLTKEQEDKVSDVMLHHFEEVENIKNTPGHENRVSEMQGINAQRDVALKNLLNGGQFLKYQQHLQDMQQIANDRRAGGMK